MQQASQFCLKLGNLNLDQNGLHQMATVTQSNYISRKLHLFCVSLALANGSDKKVHCHVSYVYF